jgi:hypothetical protein
MRLHRIIQMTIQMQKQIQALMNPLHKGPLRVPHPTQLVSLEDSHFFQISNSPKSDFQENEPESNFRRHLHNHVTGKDFAHIFINNNSGSFRRMACLMRDLRPCSHSVNCGSDRTL